MNFDNDAQKVCYSKIGPWMKEIFGEFADAKEDYPSFGVSVGSAYTSVGVHAYGDDAIVRARSWVVTEVEIEADLAKFLLKETDDIVFGGFGLDSEDDIFFQQTILGSSVDRAELKRTVMSVASIADEYDDKIVSQWGGQRASDRS